MSPILGGNSFLIVEIVEKCLTHDSHDSYRSAMSAAEQQQLAALKAAVAKGDVSAASGLLASLKARCPSLAHPG